MKIKIYVFVLIKKTIKEWYNRGGKFPSVIPICPQLMEIKYNFQSQQTFRCSKIVPFKLLTGYILNG